MLIDFCLFQCEPYDYVEDLVENMQVHHFFGNNYVILLAVTSCNLKILCIVLYIIKGATSWYFELFLP